MLKSTSKIISAFHVKGNITFDLDDTVKIERSPALSNDNTDLKGLSVDCNNLHNEYFWCGHPEKKVEILPVCGKGPAKV